MITKQVRNKKSVSRDKAVSIHGKKIKNSIKLEKSRDRIKDNGKEMTNKILVSKKDKTDK